MRFATPLLRVTISFLAGVLAIVIPFVGLIALAVIGSNASHGSPSATDYGFAVLTLGLLTTGFAVGGALLDRQRLVNLPGRTAGIAGACAAAALLVTAMLVGEPLGFSGAGIVAIGSGMMAALALLRSREYRTVGKPA
ncbi:MAG TPA: hypothetical protein VFG84_03825 [Gemmatimonadaceae bacterium]|nr:hypothetical protein [Gemmatimonadaceae bacterium]